MLPNGNMLVSHKEFCSNISPSVVDVGGANPTTNMPDQLTPLQLMINPGDGRTFPWLNGVAMRFEKYKFRSLKLEYLPTCSTLESGGIAISPIYDPADPLPTYRTALYNAEGTKRGPVYKPLTVPIPSKRISHEKYVRVTHEGLVDANELRLSDLGYFAISLTDTSSKINFGDIFISYTVELSCPRLGDSTALSGHYSWRGDTRCPSGEHPSPLGLGHNTVESRDGQHPSNTVMFDVLSDSVTYETSGGNALNTSIIEFKEPFSGVMTYYGQDQATSVAGTAPTGGLGVNNPDWALQAGESHKKPWAITELFHSVTDGVGAAIQTVKVIAEAGQVIQFVHSSLVGVADFIANITLTAGSLGAMGAPLLLL